MKTETGAEIAKRSGKFDRLQREVTAKLANRLIAGTTLCAVKAPRGDAFDPVSNPGAPGAPRPLGSLAQPQRARVRRKASEEGVNAAEISRPGFSVFLESIFGGSRAGNGSGIINAAGIYTSRIVRNVIEKRRLATAGMLCSQSVRDGPRSK